MRDLTYFMHCFTYLEITQKWLKISEMYAVCGDSPPLLPCPGHWRIVLSVPHDAARAARPHGSAPRGVYERSIYHGQEVSRD